jgi:putative solute:sodium symporter small subunit
MDKGLTAVQEYWQKALRLSMTLLLIWVAVSFGLSYFARELNFEFFGWPFSFYMAAQGSLIIYGLLIAFYAFAMNRLDHAYGLDEESEE